ncbi:MAG: 2-oxoacid ferredoxin oxidoreductase [Candidatus Aenigmarchaeota archaeon]|nr:2-oxoacid ferredoxin oxidoreductase [Candidatus Aenigmarchaeota archaeon]
MDKTRSALRFKQVSTQELPNWCGGCGDFNILFALKGAVAELDIPLENVVLVSGIGCGSKTPHFIKTYGFEGLHGRILPVATGVKLANKDLTVIAIGGDGDGYGIGAGHLFHTLRRNFDMTYIVQNNAVYGLTKGQTSPTSEKGFKSNSTPSGALEDATNPMVLGITTGATYVARGYAYDVDHLKKLIIGAVEHKGFSLLDVFQPCTTYNKIQTVAWYKQHLKKLEDDTSFDSKNKQEALKRAMQWGETIWYGKFYQERKSTYEEGLPQIAKASLLNQMRENQNIDISPLMNKFK